MFKFYPVLIGLRYTSAKRKNHFISFISLTSMVGLIIGVALLITVLSVMNGFDRELQQRILGMVPHAVIKPYSDMRDWQTLQDSVLENEKVLAAAPFINAQGMVTRNGAVHGVQLNGVLPEEETSVSIISEHMIRGSLEDLKSGEFGMIIGEILSRQLRVDVGDKVTVVLPEASLTPAGVFPRLKRFVVKGIFSVGADLDASLTMIHMDDAAKMLRIKGSVHGLRLKMHDLFDAPYIARQIAMNLDEGFYSVDWTRTHGNLFQAIRMEKTMIGLLLMVIVAVAAFNIISTLVMVVTDKKADIAILRTMGASPKAIMGIFVVQGAYIGIVGTLVGTVLGVLLALNVSDIIQGIESLLKMQFLNPDVYFISDLPSQLLLDDVLVISGTALIMSLLATLYPAWRASKVQPAEALRYE
ncbi:MULTISPECIES: lipoprotein-releasing ABC transporter permease subunit [unclassified Oleiphilus]|uniref:lipoprotein-releasing ABC transporter permease subunit n=4 Tax=Oleiphilus TaxID=141450 RepID=UPI0007C38335|nr:MULTISPECIES: lipoprotein-releasing ABC transporter permease subunit [unclassified Oleiphilus]KZY72917.1 cell division protein FtsX [Oleiphilus sp. HI0068]KZY75622.1 cell division protein FtsX [Oleiphilus sp. HI0069]KZY95075.1 cell division protein FtsX [Oleiphilus sp. HI0072]KZZ09042.1 cell division protein FtsX [Oleiphilus sp. HI0078]KZZ20466.1 cell division protein FtsX [Oleiphilus sp. HI0081]